MGKSAAERRALASGLMGAFSSMAIIHVGSANTPSKDAKTNDYTPNKAQSNK